jgi:hypothetical protein
MIAVLNLYSDLCQFASEALGKAEKTEFDAPFERMGSRLDRAKECALAMPSH